jgi:Fic family protein
MMKAPKVYVYQQDNWPNFFWNEGLVATALANVRYKQGRVIGLINTLGFTQKKCITTRNAGSRCFEIE